MKNQSLIKKSTAVGFICLVFNCSSHSKSALSLDNQVPNDLYSCVDASKRWDYIAHSCMAPRNWQKVPKSYRDRLDRPLNLKELKQAKSDMKLKSWRTISTENAPHAIILIGTAGSGKSSLVPSLNKWFTGYNQNNYVQFDGDILRKNHKDYREISSLKSVAYTDAWLVAKPHFATMKKNLLNQIITEHRNVVIPTGVHGQRYYKIMKEHGYRISLIGIYVDFKTAFYRGMNRAEWTGRTYTGGYQHWQTGLKHILALSKASKNLPTLLLNNSNFNSPQQMKLGELSLQIK
ncbi:MAG: zeta toxin family protein [Oligoflexales bacterium]